MIELTQEEIRKELIDDGCYEDDHVIHVGYERMCFLMNAYNWNETENFYYINGIDCAIYYIEKEIFDTK
jgi:hypothetical protein